MSMRIGHSCAQLVVHLLVTPSLQIVQNSKGSPVTVKVVRGSADRVVTLTLTPREWSGRGLLGCNIVPLEIARDR